jgi:cell division protein FtsL
MTAIEHKELKGITIKNLVVTVVSTASIVVSVMTCYFQLKNDIYYIKTQVDTQNRINEIRLKVLEGTVAVLQQQVNEIKNQNQFKTNYKK